LELDEGNHVIIDLCLKEGDGIRFEVEASEAVDVTILDKVDYAAWINGKCEIPKNSYVLFEDQRYTFGEFWAPEDNEYCLIVINQESGEQIAGTVLVKTIFDQ
jgi:hypothetical protein